MRHSMCKHTQTFREPHGTLQSLLPHNIKRPTKDSNCSYAVQVVVRAISGKPVLAFVTVVLVRDAFIVAGSVAETNYMTPCVTFCTFNCCFVILHNNGQSLVMVSYCVA